MRNSSMEAAVRQRFVKLKTTWNERQRRLWAAAEAKSVGYNGVSLVHRATGISRRAIHAGLKELAAVGLFRLSGCVALHGPLETDQNTRGNGGSLGRPGGTHDAGRSGIAVAMDVQEHATFGSGIASTGIQVSHRTVADLLHEADYSLQANRKTREGTHTRTAMPSSSYINRQVQSIPNAEANR